jgi:hypothetical protein
LIIYLAEPEPPKHELSKSNSSSILLLYRVCSAVVSALSCSSAIVNYTVKINILPP